MSAKAAVIIDTTNSKLSMEIVAQRPKLHTVKTKEISKKPPENLPPKKYDLESFSRRKLINWASYRVPMKIAEGIIVSCYSGSSVYYVCPRCRVSMEREYTTYCDNCGQKLDWRGFRKALLRRAGKQGMTDESGQ